MHIYLIVYFTNIFLPIDRALATGPLTYRHQWVTGLILDPLVKNSGFLQFCHTIASVFVVPVLCTNSDICDNLSLIDNT